MTAQVTKIDSATGKVGLNSAEGPLDLHFPPESLSNVKVGDTLTLRLGFV